jgi:aspartate beta-hydroxylase
MSTNPLADRLQQANDFVRTGEVLQAEFRYLAILKEWPQSLEALTAIAELALLRDDTARAIQFFQQAMQLHPGEAPVFMRFAEVLIASGQSREARKIVEAVLYRLPANSEAWLMLGWLRKHAGDAQGALRAWYQAINRAHRAGIWLGADTTPPHLLEPVSQAAESLRIGSRELFLNSYETLRQEVGAGVLSRVDRAVQGYLGEWDASPPDARQRPKFFYFPDLPPGPYHDPFLQPWAQQLLGSYPGIRSEAIRVLKEDQRLADFLEFPAGSKVEEYLQGAGPRPSWEALFFYRHGQRFDENHVRCPQTSAALESIELCRIADQAPEICFSVLSPGSHIMPHYGVTNTRLVMHLPLLVPQDCALRIVDGGEHCWREGELMMFDDTFQHEAWNRSASTRMILLMDCWNPHLTDPERLAVKQLVETISDFQRLDNFAPLDPAGVAELLQKS